jgi:hypothetical protein
MMDGPLDDLDRTVTDGPPGSSTVAPSAAPSTIIEGPMFSRIGSSETMDEAWAPPAAVAARNNAARMRMLNNPPRTPRRHDATLASLG